MRKFDDPRRHKIGHLATVMVGYGVRSTLETFLMMLSGKHGCVWQRIKTIRLPRKNMTAKLGIRAGKYRQLLRVFMERGNGDTALLKKQIDKQLKHFVSFELWPNRVNANRNSDVTLNRRSEIGPTRGSSSQDRTCLMADVPSQIHSPNVHRRQWRI